MNKVTLDNDISKILQKARNNYGHKNQILVCMEELNELACVLAKYPRYDSEIKATAELHDKVLDELADVIIILDHVQNIFTLTDYEVSTRINQKIERLSRWIEHSSSMQETVDDRTIAASKDVCKECNYRSHNRRKYGYMYDNYCCPCLKAQATEGIAPYFKKNTLTNRSNNEI